MFIKSRFQELIRLTQEESLENEINSTHCEKILKMIKEIESYFIDLDYEEMVRSTVDEKEDMKAAEIERQIALAHGIVVNKSTSPHLYELVNQSLQNIGVTEIKDLTIIIQRFAEKGAGEDLFNAFCATTRTGSIFISFTPMLLNLLNDMEVMDVIGHELAHAIVPLPQYLEDYFYFVWGDWVDGLRELDPEIPEPDLLQIKNDIQDIIDVYFDIETDAKIIRLIRLKELTADRFGLVASRSYKASCSSLMKQHTLGIDERFFDYNPAHLIHQLDELAGMHKDPAMRWVFDATHPVLPARIAALDVFSKSAILKKITGEDDDIAVNTSNESESFKRYYSEEETTLLIDEILRKSELYPQDDDLLELKLVACLFHQVVKSLSIPSKLREKMVRRMVWEKYRDIYASIPKEIFESHHGGFKNSISQYGKLLVKVDDRHRRSIIRSLIGFLKEKKLLRHETKNYIIQTGISLGLKKSIIINYLKRVGAWGRYTRKK